jgi:two-component system, NtrC family, nitrogen regulation sensor histidine kinase NtrY
VTEAPRLRTCFQQARDIALALGVAVPPALVCTYVLSAHAEDAHHEGWTLLALAILLSTVIAVFARRALSTRFRTLASVLAAYREGDFSIRARTHQGDALLHDVLVELNLLGDSLRSHRLGEMEAWALLQKVLAEVDVVVLAFDESARVRLANDAAAKLLKKSSAVMLGASAETLGIGDLLSGDAPRALSREQGGSWQLRRGSFRLSGEPHTLVVLSDLSAALRDNEHEAWQRLIRVMGHEINNSLTPIQSIAQSLEAQLHTTERAPDWEQDHVQGLAVIARRAEALGRFMARYAALARLPKPQKQPVEIRSLLQKLVALEQRCVVTLEEGPEVLVSADADQIEQALINLLKNAAEASLETDGSVQLRWTRTADSVEIEIEDQGLGVQNTENLFVPFFTTKPSGSGIGLVLARQIIEAHQGELSLGPRPDKRPGASARVRLPSRTS